MLRAQKPWTVSVDRLKPYFSPVISAPGALSSSVISPPPAAATQSVPPPAASPATFPAPAPTPAPVSDVVTRAGRTVRPPERYSA